MNPFKKKKSDLPRRRLTGSDVTTASSSDIFRRNRTLTGTTSDRLASIDSRADLESPRTHVHHLSIRRRKVFSTLMVVFASTIFIWVLVSNFTATVVVGVSGVSISKSADVSIYEKTIQEYLGSNPMSRLRPLLDQSALSIYVSSKLPEVEDIAQQNIMGIGKTNFSIKMRTPVAGWKINDKQYYVDSKGIPFERNYFSTPTVQIVDNNGVSLKTGTAIASKRFLGFVGRVVALTKAGGYTVTQAVLPVDTARELDIRLLEGNYLIKLSIDRSAGEQVEDMVRSVRYFTTKGQTPSYIDVRVSGKAFYK